MSLTQRIRLPEGPYEEVRVALLPARDWLGVYGRVSQAAIPVRAPRVQLPTSGDACSVVLACGDHGNWLSARNCHLPWEYDCALATVNVKLGMACTAISLYLITFRV